MLSVTYNYGPKAKTKADNASPGYLIFHNDPPGRKEWKQSCATNDLF